MAALRWERPFWPGRRVSSSGLSAGTLAMRLFGLMGAFLFFERSPDDEPRYETEDGAAWEQETDPERLTTELSDRYWERLRLFAARRTRNAALAEEVAQKTILRAFEALRAGQVRDRKALPAFLFQTALHLCMHHYRSADRESRALAAFAELGGGASREKSVLTDLIAREKALRVREALDSLPPAERDLLRACFVESEDSEAIARRFGTSQATLRVRKHRALKKLAALLGRHGRNAGGGEGT